MVRIRLSRKGRKNAPSYRIVVADKRAKRDGKFIEIIGHYNPTEDPNNIVYQKDRYEYWISKGAQPSNAVTDLISGTYKFEPYTRQNEKSEETTEKSESTKKEEKEKKNKTETDKPESVESAPEKEPT